MSDGFAVEQLWRYPVKSLGGERLDRAALGPLGVDGDRRWAVCERETGKALTAKRVAALLDGTARTEGDVVVVTLPGGREVVAGAAGTDEAVAGWLDRDVVLRRAEPDRGSSYAFPEDPFDDGSPATEIATLPGAFFDATPLHLLTTATLAALRDAAPERAWDVRRFRPNLLLAGGGAGFVEDGWVGRTLALGSARAMVVSPCPRCAMTTRPQADLPRDVDVLRAIHALHDGNTGVYAVVTQPGEIAVGDALARE